MKTVYSYAEFWDEIKAITNQKKEDEMLFFRGQSAESWKLQPSIFRGSKDKECDHYHDIMVDYPEEFKKHEHLSNLVKMQHYGVSTRLVDITSNPHMALFFAVEQKPNEDGAVWVIKVKKSDILHHTSDKALMLACLPPLSADDKAEIKRFCETHRDIITEDDIKGCPAMKRFLHEIRGEYPAFETEIVGEHLLKTFFVKAYHDNQRMKVQSGAFMIVGLDEQYLKNIENQAEKIVIVGAAKKELLKDLELFGISNSTVYPDFERRAMFLAHRQIEWTDIGEVGKN